MTSPALQADSLPSEPPGKPTNTGVGSLSVPQCIILTHEMNWGLLHCRWILTGKAELPGKPSIVCNRLFIMEGKLPQQKQIPLSWIHFFWIKERMTNIYAPIPFCFPLPTPSCWPTHPTKTRWGKGSKCCLLLCGHQGTDICDKMSVAVVFWEQEIWNVFPNLTVALALYSTACVHAHSCSTLCDPRLLCPWDSPGKNPGVGCHFLLQGIFPSQWWNPRLLHCRQILYPEPPGTPHMTEQEMFNWQVLSEVGVGHIFFMESFSCLPEECVSLTGRWKRDCQAIPGGMLN